MRRRALALPTLALAGIAVIAAATPALAAAPLPRQVATVSGVSGTIADIALSPDGSTGYVVDQTDEIAIFDTATNQVTGHSFDFSGSPGPFDTPTSVSVAGDGDVYVTAGTWLVILNPDGSFQSNIGLPSAVAFRSMAPVNGGPSAVASAASDKLYRWNIGASISEIGFAPATPPDALAAVAVGPGDGNDNDVVVAGTVGGAGVLYVFDSPFALSGPAHVVALPGTTSAYDVALNAAGTEALVTAPTDGLAFLVDVASGTIEHTITTPHPPIAAVFSPDGGTAYLTGAGAVSVVDTSDGSVAGTSTTDATQLLTAAVSPSGARLWAGDDVPGGAVLMLAASAVTGPGTTSGTAGTALSAGFAASGFDLPVTYAVSPVLPAGLTLDAASGAITGTPTAAQAATAYTVTASSADGDSASTTWSLTVAAAASGSNGAGSGTSGRLAQSGQDIPWLLVGGAFAALAGGAALVATKRRARSRA